MPRAHPHSQGVFSALIMNLKELKELIKLVDQKQFAEFELEQPDFKLRIKRNTPVVVQPTSNSTPLAPAPLPGVGPPAMPVVPTPSAPPPAAAATPAPAAAPEEAMHLIVSPIVGTFYRAPSPTADPYVEIGDRVEPGTVLCLIEAMKLMNEITSDVAGEVVKIFVENGQAVEYGQPLFGIRVS